MRSTSGSGFWIWCSPPSRMCTCGSTALVSCRMCSTPGCVQPTIRITPCGLLMASDNSFSSSVPGVVETPGRMSSPGATLGLLADRDEVAARPQCSRFQDLRWMYSVIPHVRRQRGVLAVKIVLHTAREQSPGLVGNVNFDVGIYCQ